MNRVIEKLKYEENQTLIKFVAEKVIEQCVNEPAFIDKVLNDDKTLDDCIAYITSLAKKEAVEGCAAIEDNTVRGWAIHYFDEDELEDWKSLSQKAKEEAERKASISKAKTAKKTNTKKKETDLDEEDYEDEEEMDEKEEDKVKLTPPKPKKIKGVAEGQVSLFDW